MSDEIKCEHDKVYSNSLLLSLPPKREWQCSKCGITGTVIVDVINDKKTKNILLRLLGYFRR